MIAFLKSWCEGIVVAVIISILIEAILPEGNHKKYVKVVIGIYIIFTILNPFLGKLDTNIKWDTSFNLTSIETASVNEKDIQALYANGIKETLKNNIEEEFDYGVNQLEIKYDDQYETIQSIQMNLTQKGVQEIEKVEIGNTVQNSQQNEQYEEVKKYISENYEIEPSKIFIN